MPEKSKKPKKMIVRTPNQKRWDRLVAFWKKRWAVIILVVILAAGGSIFLWNSFAATASDVDLNGDGIVNAFDLSMLLGNWNKSGTGLKGDIDKNGKVNAIDLSLVLGQWNKHVTTTPPPTTPPTTPPPTTPPPTTPPPTPPGTSPYLIPGISKGVVEDNNGQITQDAADMQTLGVTWDRGWFDCGDGQSMAGMVNSLKAKGVSFIPSYNCDINMSIADYKAKLTADMKILVPLGVHVWEIGNEMDGGWTETNNYCNNNETQGNMVCAQKAYLEFQKAAFETVHANDPQGVMLYGGLSSYDVNLGPWLKEMNTSQAWQWMDGMGFHPYGNNLQASMSSMDVLKSYMEKNATWASKPIWITEIGCFSSGIAEGKGTPCSPQSESGKAQYLVNLYNALKVWNKGTSFEIRTPICWYILHEHDDNPAYGLTIIGNPRQYLEAFTAYKNYKF